MAQRTNNGQPMQISERLSGRRIGPARVDVTETFNHPAPSVAREKGGEQFEAGAAVVPRSNCSRRGLRKLPAYGELGN